MKSLRGGVGIIVILLLASSVLSIPRTSFAQDSSSTTSPVASVIADAESAFLNLIAWFQHLVPHNPSTASDSSVPTGTAAQSAAVGASQTPAPASATPPTTSPVNPGAIQTLSQASVSPAPSVNIFAIQSALGVLAARVETINALLTSAAHTPSSPNLTSQIAALQQAISSQTYGVSSSIPLGGGSSNTIAAMSNIGQLTNIAITNPTITGGSITNTSFSGGPVSATSLSVSGDTTLAGNLNVTSTNATSTFAGGLTAASSTFNILQNGNVGIGTTAPQATLDVNGILNTQALNFAGGYTSERTFLINTFQYGVANQKVQIYWPANTRVQGEYDITVASEYCAPNAVGAFTKSFGSLYLVENGLLRGLQTSVPKLLGAANTFTVSDPQWDATNSRWYVVIADLSGGSCNQVSVNIKSYTANGWSKIGNNAAAMSMSSVYTTDPTVFPRLYMNFPAPFGIGTSTPPTALTVQQTANNSLGGLSIIKNGGSSGLFLYHDGTYATIDSNYLTGGSASPLALKVGGTQALTIATSTFVGIGTTTPWGKLSITGVDTGATPGFVFADSNNKPQFVIEDNGKVGIGVVPGAIPVSGGGGTLSIQGTGTNGLDMVRYGSTFGTGIRFESAFGTQSSPATSTAGQYLGTMEFMSFNGAAFSTAAKIYTLSAVTASSTDSSGHLVFATTRPGQTGETESMRITASGNVGIGTTVPNYLLDVNGTGHFTNLVDAASFVATSSTATSTFAGGFIAGGSNGMTIVPSGYAAGGIPTESFGGPVSSVTDGSEGQIQFVAQDTGGVSITRYGGSYGTDLKILAAGGTASAPTAYGGAYGPGYIEFGGYNGTTFSPTAYIYVQHVGAGGSYTPTNSGGTMAFDTVAASSTVLTQRMIIDGAGNILISPTLSNASARLEVQGSDTASTSAFLVANSASTTEFSVLDNGNATLNGNLIQSSDQRLKTNVTNLDASSSLAAINALNPVTFNWIDPAKSSVPQYGFIAQDVQKIFPSLVAVTAPTALTPDGTLSLNYIDLVAPVVKAIQALSSEIALIENTIAGFAQSFTTHQLNADQLCLDGTCISKTQLAAILASANQSTTNGGSSAQPSQNATAGTAGASAASSSASNTISTPPIIQINGNNPAIVQVGVSYADLGATITGPQADLNLDINTFVNGAPMNPIVIDTTAAATDTIDYVVTDTAGNIATSTRTVIVEAPPSAIDATTTSQ